MNKKAKTILILSLLVLILFNSCIGLSIDIQLNRNGSGRLTMEYRVNQMFETIGTLDGNERFPFIPTGRTDFERSIEQISGAKIASYSERVRGQDIYTNIVIDFDNTQALMQILNPPGTGSSITAGGTQGNFNLILSSPDDSQYDQELLELTETLFTDYNFNFNFNSGSNSTMTVTDGFGRTISSPAGSIVNLSGRNVSFSMNIFDLITVTDGIGLSIIW